MKDISIGGKLSGEYKLQVVERSRLHEVRKKSARAHGIRHNGTTSEFMSLPYAQRALIEDDVARDIVEHEHEWYASHVAGVAYETGKANLILDQGLNSYFSGTFYFGEWGKYCCVGTGTTAAAISDTGLVSESKRTGTYLTGSGNCGTSYAGSTQTNKRTYDFAIEVSNQNYGELGWSHSASIAANLNSRALVSGGTVTVLTGQQLRVVYSQDITYSATSLTPITYGVTGWPISPATTTEGDFALLKNALGGCDVNGQVESTSSFADSKFTLSGQIYLWNGVTTLASWPNQATHATQIYSVVLSSLSGSAYGSYTSGSFTRKLSFGYMSASSFSSTAIRSISLTNAGYGFAVNLDQAQTKSNTYRLKLPSINWSLTR
jgi:hypothetical protein